MDILPQLTAYAAAVAVLVAVAAAYEMLWRRPRSFIAHYSAQGLGSVPFRPLVGELPELIRSIRSDDVWSCDRAARAAHGAVYTTCFGPLPRLVVCDPDVANDVLARRAKHYQKTPAGRRILGPLLGRGLFFSEGELWRRQRGLISPAFHFANLQQMVRLMAEASRQALDGWAARFGGGDVEVHRELSSLTLDVLASAALGSSFRDEPAVATAVYDAFGRALEDIQARNLSVIGLLPVVSSIPTPGKRRIDAAVKAINEVVTRVIEDRREGRSRSLCDGDDLLDHMMRSGMGDELVRAETMTQLLAGHETTSNLVAWAVSLLGSRPRLRARLRAEASAALGGAAEPTWDTLKRLPLMAAVLNETMRLFPPVPYIRRIALEDNEAGGVRVRAGTVVSVCTYLLHRDAGLWGDDAADFVPDRWLADGFRPRAGSFFPFGLGPRRCIGQTFAVAEAKVILSGMLLRHDFELAPGQKIVPELNLVMRPRHGVVVRFTDVGGKEGQ